MPITLSILTAVYALMSAFAWYFSQKKQNYPIKAENTLLAMVLLLHGATVALPILVDKILIAGFGYTVSLLVWLMLSMYWIGQFFFSLRGLQLLLLPIASLAMLGALLLPGTMTGYAVHSLPLLTHITLSLLAYSLFALAAMLAAWVLFLHHRLRRRRFSPFLSFLPPLLSMEKLMIQGIWVGFILLTTALLGGMIYSAELKALLTHKAIFGLLAWLTYGGLLLKHTTTAWRGRNAAVWTIVGFAGLFLAYSGSKFVWDVIL